MDKIQLHCNSSNSVTMISNKFIDQYMPNANGEFVKVYLYLLRCMHTSEFSCTISAIADHLNHTETDVKRALLYWEKLGLVQLGYNQDHKLVSISLSTPELQPFSTVIHPGSLGLDKETSTKEPASDAPIELPSNKEIPSYTKNDLF